MKRWVWLLLLLLPATLMADSLEIGQIFWHSIEYPKVRTGCLLTYNKTTKQFACQDATISIVREAGQFNSLPSGGAPLSGSEPEYRAFSATTDTCVGFGFVVPAQTTGPLQFRIVYVTSSVSPFSVVWALKWCSYKEGDPTCAIPVSFAGFPTVADQPDGTDRSDALISTTVPWVAGDAVLGRLCRLGTDGGDTHPGEARMQFGVLELTQDTSGG